MRPMPTSPQACSPEAGINTRMPSLCNCWILRRLAGFCHISTFIAGASTNAHLRAEAISVIKLSAKPCASLAMVFAEAGAISIKSAARVALMCAMLPLFSLKTGLPLNASKVCADTNPLAALDNATVTSCPSFFNKRTSSQDLYAAMPPVTANKIRFCICVSLKFEKATL